MSGYRRFAIFLIVLGIVLAVASGYRGFGYYLLPTAEKFHHPLHNELKPSGFWGHAFGFIGTFIILLNFCTHSESVMTLGTASATSATGWSSTCSSGLWDRSSSFTTQP